MIELADVYKIYGSGESEVRALDGVTCTLTAGELIAITGPSGSGKSTLMNILGCLDRPTSGRYTLEGQDVSSLDDDALANIRNKFIGFVFQSFNLLPRKTALENVALPLVYAGVPKIERLRRAALRLEQVGLGERLHHQPNQLSGGQCQRVAIARALVTEPKLLLADEPTGNLDTRSGSEIMRLLIDMQQRASITVAIVTHDPKIAEMCQRRLRIVDGKIAEDVRSQ